MYIGRKLKEIRRLHKMTLKELSEKSGVQIATLSRIENEKMVGTLDSHMEIAKALGVDVTQLYKDITPARSKIDLQPPKNNTEIFIHSPKSAYEILTGNVLQKKMMPILLKIDPKGKTNQEKNPLGTEKFIFVLEGRIDVHIAGEIYEIKRHNSLYFEASLEHYFVNKSTTKPAQIICICTPVAL